MLVLLVLLASLVQSVKTNSTPILQIRSVGELSEGEDVLLMASRSRHPPLCSEVKGLEWFDIKYKMLQRLGQVKRRECSVTTSLSSPTWSSAWTACWNRNISTFHFDQIFWYSSSWILKDELAVCSIYLLTKITCSGCVKTPPSNISHASFFQPVGALMI